MGSRLATIVAVLATIVVAAQLIFFALFQPVWSPIDEFNHFFYVNYLSYAHRPPLYFMPYLATLDPSVPPELSIPPSFGRGVSTPRQQYVTESIQPPGYYLLVVPAFVTSSHGSYRQVYVVRLATAGLALLMVPCIFILARLVVPRSPWVWGAAGVLPALSRGYTFNLSQVTNDGLAALVGGISILMALWLLRRRLDWRWGVVAGLTAGVALVTKVTVYYVPVMLAAIFLVQLRRRPKAIQATAAGLISAVIAGLFFLPWAAFNLKHYHAIVSTGHAPPNLAPYTNLPLPDALKLMVELGSLKFWYGESLAPAPPNWLIAAGVAGLVLCTAGFLVVPFWRERSLESGAGVVVWLVGGLVVLFTLILATHVAVLNGRYLYPLFPAIAVASAAGADRMGRAGHWLFAVSLVPLAIALAIGLPAAIRWSHGG